MEGRGELWNRENMMRPLQKQIGLLFLTYILCVSSAMAAALVAYDDQLLNSFEDWSWATHNLSATSPVYSGTHSVSFEPDGWSAVYLHRNGGVSASTYDGLEFFIHGGASGGQDLRIVFGTASTTLANIDLNNYLPGGNLAAGAWVNVRIPFDSIGLGTSTFTELYFQDATGGNQSTTYLDDIRFTERPVGPLTLNVDPGLDRHPINPLIYGVSGNDSPWAGQPHYTVNRWGGNATTRYNWQIDVSNRGMDWFFMNISNDTNVGQLPNNSTADRFIDTSRASGSEPLMTMPIIGWTPFDRNTRWGFSVAAYGTQQWTECSYTGYPFWCHADAGNGVKPDGVTPVTGNNALDTSVAISPSFVTGWMSHIAGRAGTASSGGVRFFALDNEPMLWNSTHRDVHPTAVSDTEIWQRTQDYASAIKTQDAGAQVFGPVSWGWCDYFYSAKDGCGPGADFATNGPFLEWYLQQASQYQTTHGIRLIDYLDIHYYPQAGNVALSDDESEGAASLRLRSVRSLYDPTYSDESWISQPVNLIPRMKDIIARKYPGTKLAITEYNWGNDNGLTSALAQVEVLAVFGREGVDVANRWTVPAAGTRVEDAFKLFLNYDDAGGSVSGESVRAVSSRVDDVGLYAVRRNDGKLFVLLLNKTLNAQMADVQVNGGISGAVDLWGFDSSSSLSSRGIATPTASGFTLSLPARSVRLAAMSLPCSLPSQAGNLRIQKNGGNIKLTWTNVTGASDYVVYSDSIASGTFATTAGTATDGPTGLTISDSAPTRYYVVTARNSCGESPKK